MDRKEKLIIIARTLAYYYDISEPDFRNSNEKDIHSFIKSILNKTNKQLKRCFFCNKILTIKNRAKYTCKDCKKRFFANNQPMHIYSKAALQLLKKKQRSREMKEENEKDFNEEQDLEDFEEEEDNSFLVKIPVEVKFYRYLLCDACNALLTHPENEVFALISKTYGGAMYLHSYTCLECSIRKMEKYGVPVCSCSKEIFKFLQNYENNFKQE